MPSLDHLLVVALPRCCEAKSLNNGRAQQEPLLWEGIMRPTHLHRVPALGYIFLRIGAAAFGGLGASLALDRARTGHQTPVAHRRGGHRRPDLYQTAAGVHRSAGGRVSRLHPRRLVRLGGGHGGVPFPLPS